MSVKSCIIVNDRKITLSDFLFYFAISSFTHILCCHLGLKPVDAILVRDTIKDAMQCKNLHGI